MANCITTAVRTSNHNSTSLSYSPEYSHVLTNSLRMRGCRLRRKVFWFLKYLLKLTLLGQHQFCFCSKALSWFISQNTKCSVSYISPPWTASIAKFCLSPLVQETAVLGNARTFVALSLMSTAGSPAGMIAVAEFGLWASRYAQETKFN
jgi:hypothetical protein